MEKKSKTISKCQVSGINDLETIISLGFLPPVNKMQKVGKKKEETTFFPIDLMYSKFFQIEFLMLYLNNHLNDQVC